MASEARPMATVKPYKQTVVAKPMSDGDVDLVSEFYAEWLKERGWEVVKTTPLLDSEAVVVTERL